MDTEPTQFSTKIKLQYGLRGEQIVHISEIADDERGLKCGCICPGCGMTLQARIGKIKQPHFSHNNAKCDLKSAQQSALHILAKDIIEKEKRIKCPDVVFGTSDLDLDNEYFIYGGYDKKIFKKRGLLNCETVMLEKRVSDIIPDIVVTSGNRTFFIEIAVTHFIDETKLEKIRRLKIPTLEINLSVIIDSPISKEKLKEIIVNSFDNKSWVYRPNEEQYKAEYFKYIKDEFTKRENIENEYIRKEENPCALCANMRRGALNTAALDAGCKKVALGHHLDDAVETFLMSLIYEGRLASFAPSTFLDRTGITVLRPLLYCREYETRSLVEKQGLPIVKNACPADGETKRKRVKEIADVLKEERADIYEKVFGAMQRLPLPEWEPKGRYKRPKDQE